MGSAQWNPPRRAGITSHNRVHAICARASHDAAATTVFPGGSREEARGATYPEDRRSHSTSVGWAVGRRGRRSVSAPRCPAALRTLRRGGAKLCLSAGSARFEVPLAAALAQWGRGRSGPERPGSQSGCAEVPAPGRGARASQRAGRKLPAPARGGGGRAAITAGPGAPGRASRRAATPAAPAPPARRGSGPSRRGHESRARSAPAEDWCHAWRLSAVSCKLCRRCPMPRCWCRHLRFSGPVNDTCVAFIQQAFCLFFRPLRSCPCWIQIA